MSDTTLEKFLQDQREIFAECEAVRLAEKAVRLAEEHKEQDTKASAVLACLPAALHAYAKVRYERNAYAPIVLNLPSHAPIYIDTYVGKIELTVEKFQYKDDLPSALAAARHAYYRAGVNVESAPTEKPTAWLELAKQCNDDHAVPGILYALIDIAQSLRIVAEQG